MVVLDVTIVNIALPSVQRGLHFSAANLQWIVDGYTLVFSGFLLLAGRGLQGLGGALVSPAALSIVTTTFPEGRDRTRALAIWSAIAAAGSAVGLLLGGVLTDVASWRWVFFVNVPVGVVAVALAARFVPESRLEQARRAYDLGGPVTVTGGLIVLIERRSPTALMRLGIFRIRSLAVGDGRCWPRAGSPPPTRGSSTSPSRSAARSAWQSSPRLEAAIMLFIGAGLLAFMLRRSHLAEVEAELRAGKRGDRGGLMAGAAA